MAQIENSPVPDKSGPLTDASVRTVSPQGGDKAEPKIVVREMMSFKPTIVPEKPLDEYPQDCTVLLLPEEYKHEDFRINVKIVSRG